MVGQCLAELAVGSPALVLDVDPDRETVGVRPGLLVQSFLRDGAARAPEPVADHLALLGLLDLGWTPGPIARFTNRNTLVLWTAPAT